MELENFTLPQEFDGKISLYIKTLLTYNKTHNICGARVEKEALENIYDSIFALNFLDFEPKNAIDIGSGAGFPAIALAIALQNCNFSL